MGGRGYARAVLGVGGGECSFGAVAGVGGEVGGAFEKRSGSSEAAAGLSPGGGVFEGVGDSGVGVSGGLGGVPGVAVGVGVRVGGVGEGVVGAAALVKAAVVDGGALKGVVEADLVVDGEEFGCGCGKLRLRD